MFKAPSAISRNEVNTADRPPLYSPVIWSLDTIIKVLNSSTKEIFCLENIRQKYMPNPNAIQEKRQKVYSEMIKTCSSEIYANGDFHDITADTVATLFDIIDREFCGNAITDVFRLEKHHIIFRLVGDDELHNSAATFTSVEYDHYFSVNKDMLLRAFDKVEAYGAVMVCGCCCYTRLEVLQRIFEHELVHLLVFSNWSNLLHGDEFVAISRGFFGHMNYSHGLPVAYDDIYGDACHPYLYLEKGAPIAPEYSRAERAPANPAPYKNGEKIIVTFFSDVQPSAAPSTSYNEKGTQPQRMEVDTTVGRSPSVMSQPGEASRMSQDIFGSTENYDYTGANFD